MTDLGTRRVLGITGGMGVGKTTLSERTWLHLHHGGYKPKGITVDNLRYSLLCGESYLPDEIEAKMELSRRLDVPLHGMEFNFPDISAAILHSRESLAIFRGVACPVLVERAREMIESYDGPVIIEGSALLEEGFGPLLDTPLLLLSCAPEVVESRLALRDAGRFTEEQTRQRLERQPGLDERNALAASLGIPMERMNTDNGVDQAFARVMELLGVSVNPAP